MPFVTVAVRARTRGTLPASRMNAVPWLLTRFAASCASSMTQSSKRILLSHRM